MKKSFLTAIITLFAAAAFAGGPYNLNIGSGKRSLSLKGVYSMGQIKGDDGAFQYDNETKSGSTTIWHQAWFVYNKDNGKYYFLDPPGRFASASHTSHTAEDGKITVTKEKLTNTGMNFPGSTSATLSMVLTQPKAGETARITYTWKFNNAATAPLNLRIIWFMDADLYFEGSYNDDLVSAAASAFTTGSAIGIGENNGSGLVNLKKGVINDCDTAISFFGLSSGICASKYWSNENEYAGKSPEVVKEIYCDYVNKVQKDADNNGISDAGAGCAMALQTEITVPSKCSKSVKFYSTYGENKILQGFIPTKVDN